MQSIMKLVSVFLFLLITGICKGHSNVSVLQLLVVLNVQGGHGVPRWDRGTEILPAAQLAVERINEDLSFLPEYHLEIVPVDTGTCTSDFNSEASAVINFIHQITQEEQHVVGVVGLFCTSVAQLISPLAGHRGISLLQIAGSASPVLRNNEKYPYLWHMTPSSTAYVEAVYRMMDEFGWTNIAVIGGADGIYFHTAIAFGQYCSQGGNTSQSVDVSLLILDGHVSSVLKSLKQSRKRIVFASVEATVAVEIICLAYQEDMTWPNYVWIFPDHYIEDLLFYANDVCDGEILRSALERVYLLHFHLSSSNATLTPNPYVNVMHDSIQAFALALNMTMVHLQAMNLTLEDYHLGKSDITDILQNEMMSLSFTGVLGRVEFDNNRERQTRVDIIQIRNGSALLVGNYDPVSRETVLENYSNPMDDMLNNEIPRIYIHSPLPLTVLLSTVTGVCIILTTIVLALFLYYRKAVEVKATSLPLSLLMILGCYLLFMSTLFHTVSDAIVNHGPFFCNAVIWCAGLGIHFIFGAVLVRMLRIYRIFGFFRKMGGKRWSDWFLCIVVFSIVGAEAMLLLVWLVADVLTVRDVETFQATASPPHYEVVQFCYSEYLGVWTIVVFGEVGVLISVVAFLAFKTRKIRQKHFKDTKKVNIYLFMMIMLICVLIPFWFVLRAVKDNAASIVVLYLGYGGTATLCQLLLFVPKVLPPLIRDILPKMPEERLRSRAIATVSTFRYFSLKAHS